VSEGGPHAEAVGETVGEAKWAAVRSLQRRYPGLTADHVHFDVREEDEEVYVAATVDVDAWQADDGREKAPAERVRELLEQVAGALDLRASVDLEEDDDEIRATVVGTDLGLFIGKHGQTIDAVQQLAVRIAFRGIDGPRKRIVVDAAGYRERREASLHRMADLAADDAIAYGRPVSLDSMGPIDRKLVHEYLRDRGDVETYSEGDEPDRHLVVAPLRPSA
jgi:spoIIIJ-associated protein